MRAEDRQSGGSERAKIARAGDARARNWNSTERSLLMGARLLEVQRLSYREKFSRMGARLRDP